jgi:hypothetical protein
MNSREIQAVSIEKAFYLSRQTGQWLEKNGVKKGKTALCRLMGKIQRQATEKGKEPPGPGDEGKGQ